MLQNSSGVIELPFAEINLTMAIRAGTAIACANFDSSLSLSVNFENKNDIAEMYCVAEPKLCHGICRRRSFQFQFTNEDE